MKTHPTSRTSSPNLELITAHGIALEIQRSPRGVMDTLARLNVQPEGKAGTGKLYRREAIETVRAAMRAPNKGTKPNEGEG